MRNTYYAFFSVFFALMITDNLSANDTVDEVTVTSSFIEGSLEKLQNQLHIVDGNDIQSDASQSLGESIDNLLGVDLLIRL